MASAEEERRATEATAFPAGSCPTCGRESRRRGADGGSCPHCLLQLGLSVEGATVSSASVLGSLRGDSVPPSAQQIINDGVLAKFGDYELLSEIARGGMGVVYRAKQLSLHRLVAVKLILAGQLATPESLERFRLEAQSAGRLHHPGIVRIYEIGEYETQHFFSMELIDGASLAECMREFSLDPQADSSECRAQEFCIAEIMAQVARALEFAHQHGVLHRDLKPSNILIDREGQPHLTDFGLAKLTGRETSGLTLSNAVLGTPGYLAPEQASGSDDITMAADIYGLGATLYELLTRRPPFAGSNAVETMWMAIDQTPSPPRQTNPAVHRDLETIALRCLEKKPSDRYPSAAVVADELERFVRCEPIQARPVSQWEHLWRWCQRNPVLTTMATGLMLAILVGGAASLWQWSRAEQANVTLRENVADLEWDAIEAMLRSGESSRALAKVASLIRDDPTDWKAAMFAMSVMEQRRFPVPAAPLIRHPGGTELTVARISPDGRLIVTASFDGTARLWNSITSEQALPELRHRDAVNWAEFRPDGRLLATCSDDRTARLWDVDTGEAIGQPLEHDEAVTRVHFSPDGRFLMTRTRSTVSIRDADDGRLLREPLQHDGQVVSAKFLAGGRLFFTAQRAGADSVVQAWETETGEQRMRLGTGPLSVATITDDLSRVVTVDRSSTVRVWDPASGEKLRDIRSTNGDVFDAALSSSGDRLALVGANHWVRVWDLPSGIPITPELAHYYLLGGVRFLDDGQGLLTWAHDSLAQVWDATTGERIAEPLRHSHRVTYAEPGERNSQDFLLTTMSHLIARGANTSTGSAQLWQIHDTLPLVSRAMEPDPRSYDGARLSPDGKVIVLGMTTGKVWVLDTETGDPVCEPLPVNGSAWGTLFTPDSRRLITTTSRGQVCVWSIPEGKRMCDPVQLPTTIQPAEMTADGKYFATGSTDGFVRLWDSATGCVVWESKHGAGINAIAFSPDGGLVASAGEDRLVQVWETGSGKRVQTLTGHQNEVMSVKFGRGGRRVVTASLDFSARLWDVESGRLVFVLQHQGEVLDAAFSPDGRSIATGSRDRTAMIWDVETGRPRIRSLLHVQAVRNVVFSPNGQRLLTLDFRGLRVWDVASGHPLSLHLPHTISGGTGFQSSSLRPGFSPEGDRVFLAGDSLASRLWHVPVPPPGIPSWFPEFLEAIAAQRFEVGSETPRYVSSAKLLAVRKRLLASTDTDYYTRWAQQWLRDLEDGSTEDAPVP